MTLPHTTAGVQALWAEARPDLDTSPMAVVGPLKRIQRLLAAATEPLYDGAPLTAPELDVLIKLRHTAEPVIARRLAESMSCSPAAISKTLAKLERRRFIERRASPADRRAALVTCTDSGSSAVDALFPCQLAVEAELLAGLGADRERVIEALNLLAAVLERNLRS
ncbi:MarR family transcriptional regulator [Nocardia sp. NPDC050697]|uniref:MarR family winged helix-turn-helix transcriptional regulator n=1 Tax=Nocardia sp. NPDC050697 TaxID=3155158 RepID=UPI0033FA4E3A